MSLRSLIFSGNLHGLEHALKENPTLSQEQIPLPDNPAVAHPLHRICDGVFGGYFSEHTGLEMARLFLKYGADLNAGRVDGNDSPLTAACSLHCDKLALLYISHGARIDHKGCHGGTALHWASWCGRDVVVSKLVEMKPAINQLCIDFKSTPLFWTIHGYKSGGVANRHHQVECARILLAHGADPSIPNMEGRKPAELLGDEDDEMRAVFGM